MLILDLLLPAGMLAVMITGILISRVLFHIDMGTGWLLVDQIHNAAALACFGVLTLHLLMHVTYLAAATKRLIVCWRESGVKRAVVRFAAASLVVGVLYTIAFSSYKGGFWGSVFSAELAAPVTSSAQPDTANAESVGSGSSDSESSTSSAQTAQDAKKKEDDETSSASTDSPDSQSSAVTLSEYLSKLYCTGCHNHCPLSNPQCGRSAQQIEKATAGYQTEYAAE